MRLSALIVAPAVALLACTAASTGEHATKSPSTSAPRSVAAAAAPQDWPVYHFDSYRSADYLSMPHPTISKIVASKSLDGAVYGSPIVVGGNVVVATENNTVYKFDSSYRLLWQRHLGAPSPASQRKCGNIDPLGITGTPAYSATSKLVYVAPEFSGSPPTHQLNAIDFGTGAVTWHKSLDLPGVEQAAMQERGALALVGSRVYVPFGGLAGDCGGYKGRVVGYALNGTGNPVSFTVPTTREAGIWTPPGPVADVFGRILVAVGNGAATGAGDPYDYSDSVLELSTSLTRTDSFSPSTWRSDNSADLDLGSQGPAMVMSWIFAAGKSGTAYVLRRSHLGGIGGQVSSAKLCRSFGGAAVHADVVFVPCTDGIRAVRIDSAGTMHVLWHAPSNITGSPVLGGGRVWSLDTGAGRLYDIDMTTGQVYGSIAVGQTTRFATPAVYGQYVHVPTLTGVVGLRTS